MFKFIAQKLHPEGYRFVAIAAVITFVLLLINNYLGLIALVITIWVYYFLEIQKDFLSMMKIIYSAQQMELFHKLLK